jgi:hypothetical protein
VAKDGFDLAASHAGGPFEEIVDARAVFEVGEQGLDRHSRSAKTHAPLTFSEFRSTAEQLLQSRMRKG